MKICHVSQVIYPYVIGGSSIYCHELANFQSKAGHKITVVSVRRGIKLEEANCNYELKRFNWFKMPWDFLEMENPISPRLWWELINSDFDLIHAHSHLFFTTLFSVIISKIKNRPSVVTVHGVKAVRKKIINFLQELWLNIFSRTIFKLTDKIICLTKTDAEEIKKYGANKEKIEIIPNGVNIKLFSQSNSHGDYILWIGRFVEEKGLKYLIKSLNDISEDFPNKRVVLVGDGPLKQRLMSEVNKKGLGNVFDFMGNCSHQIISMYMKNCELFVLPSLKEGFPNSVLEAMACGKPVITTNGLKDIINGGGITVESANAKELKDAVYRIFSNINLAKDMGEIGRKKVKENWSWDVISKKIEKCYLELIASDEHIMDGMHN